MREATQYSHSNKKTEPKRTKMGYSVATNVYPKIIKIKIWLKMQARLYFIND